MQRNESTVQLEHLQNKFVTHIQKEPQKIKSFNRLPEMGVEYYFEKYNIVSKAVTTGLEEKLNSKSFYGLRKVQLRNEQKQKIVVQPKSQNYFLDSVNFLKSARTDEQVDKMFKDYSIQDRVRLPPSINEHSPARPMSKAQQVSDGVTKLTTSTHMHTSTILSTKLKQQGDLRQSQLIQSQRPVSRIQSVFSSGGRRKRINSATMSQSLRVSSLQDKKLSGSHYGINIKKTKSEGGNRFGHSHGWGGSGVQIASNKDKTSQKRLENIVLSGFGSKGEDEQANLALSNGEKTSPPTWVDPNIRPSLSVCKSSLSQSLIRNAQEATRKSEKQLKNKGFTDIMKVQCTGEDT